MKTINNKDLLSLLKIYRVLTYNMIQHNKTDNFGFKISLKQLFTIPVYNTIRSIEKTTDYAKYGFNFIEYLFSIKNYEYKLFIKDLELKVKFIENIDKELNKLQKFNMYYKEFNDMLVKLNKYSYREFFFITADDGIGLYVEFEYKRSDKTEYILNDKDSYDLLLKNEVKLNIKQEYYTNFLCKYEELEEELEYTMIF